MKKALYIATAGLLFMFLALNIVSSQSVSPLYFDLARKDTLAAVSFLQKTKLLSNFDYYKGLFDEHVLQQFAVAEANQAAEIMRLEEYLLKNPNARDVLYTLYLFYDQTGNQSQAQEYLRRAQEVDPTVTK